jgi:glucosamine--fructose-6-phosphate aminotransferase (isomerizing)
MCGIVGYTGPHQALPFVLEGLRRLEYRGYDSAGVAVLDGEGHLHTAKKAGALGNLEAFIDTGEVALNGLTGMGHTRWATHGGPTDRNAHPHTDVSGRVAVIHNGIIENFPVLRKQLEAEGIEMRSDTDTEVVAHLLGAAFDNGPTAGDLPASMAAVCRGLDGAFTLVAVHADAPGVLVAARRNSPLVVGVGDGEMFVAI